MNDDSTAGALAPLDETDAALLRELRETVDRLDPCPAGLTDDVKFALTVQALQAEVAELTQEPAALVRGEDDDPDQTATMTFSTDSVSIMLTVTPGRGGARVDGWLTCDSADVELLRPDGSSERTDVEDGRFVFVDVAAGPTRLVVHPPLARPVVTPTFAL